MSSIRLAIVLTIVGSFGIAPRTAHAQAPTPDDLPWAQSIDGVRTVAQRLGFSASAQTDSSVTFVSDRAGVHSELRARFRGGLLWHAFYTARGDSATVQRDLNSTAAALSAHFGGAHSSGSDRVWVLPHGRRIALPSAPGRLENGQYGYGIAYHAP